jgi:branched-chain amino acid transport system substrate-binding protein
MLLDNVAVFKNPESFYSTSLADEFIRKYESLGGRVTDIVPVNPDTEITAQILDVIRENGAELLYLPIEAKKLIEILKTTREMGWKPKKMSSDGLLSTVLRRYEEDIGQLEGLLAIDLYTEDVPYTSFGKKATKAYWKMYKSRATTYVAAGVEGFAVLFQAMDRCSDPGDSECINSMIRDTSEFEGLVGKVAIRSDGKAVRPLIVNAVRKGHMKFVVKVY